MNWFISLLVSVRKGKTLPIGALHCSGISNVHIFPAAMCWLVVEKEPERFHTARVFALRVKFKLKTCTTDDLSLHTSTESRDSITCLFEATLSSKYKCPDSMWGWSRKHLCPPCWCTIGYPQVVRWSVNDVKSTSRLPTYTVCCLNRTSSERTWNVLSGCDYPSAKRNTKV